MPARLDPRTDILPKAQQEIWSLLAPAPRLSFVLYGGTAVALHLGHRVSVDFDFFRSATLDPNELETSFAFIGDADTIQEATNTRVLNVTMRSGTVKVSFFGGLGIGRVNEPLPTRDSGLLVASLDDLLATKLKATLDRAESERLSRHRGDTFRRHFFGARARRVRQNVWQGPGARAAGDRFLQGRRFAVASPARSGRAPRRTRSRH